MSMQVTSISMGAGSHIPAQKEQRQEKSQPFPMEQKKIAAQDEAFFSGTSKTQAPEIKQSIAELEHISHAFNSRLKFEIDQDSKEIIIKVIDNNTDKVIKVLPPEELQRLHHSIKETIGILFDRKV